MKLIDRTNLASLFTLPLALGFCVITFLSALALREYIIEGRVSFPFYMTVCVPFLMLVLLLIVTGANISNGLMISKVTKSVQSLRAMYISMLLPVVLISFALACFKEGFETSLLLGFPFFLAATIAVPYSTHVLTAEARKVVWGNLVILSCYNCHFRFQVISLCQGGVCPSCGALNRVQPPGPAETGT